MKNTIQILLLILSFNVSAQNYKNLSSTDTMWLYNSALVIISDASFDYLSGSFQFFNTETRQATTPIFRLPEVNFGFHIDGWESYLDPNDELICIVEGKYGILRANGEIVIPFEYESFYQINYKTIVLGKNDIWFYYRLNSGADPKEISTDDLIGYGNNENEFLLFQDSTGTYFIGSDLQRTTNHIYEDYFGHEHEVFKINKGRKYGLVNSTGKLLMPLIYSSISEGYNYWIVTDREGQAMADWNGVLLTEFKYEHIDAASYNGDGTTLWYEGNKVGLIDTTGKEVTPAQYTSLQQMDNGLYYAERIDEEGEVLYGYIDHFGKEIIPVAYSHLTYFVNGLAFASKGEKYGFIDEHNSVVIPFQYDYNSSSYFDEQGYASVLLDNKCILIDRKGNFQGEGLCD